MVKKIIPYLSLFLLIFSVSTSVSAQSPVPVIMSDLGVPYTMECVKASGLDAGWPPAVDNISFTGTCSSSTPCNVGICGPVCLQSKKNENGGVKCTKYGGKKCTVYDPELDNRYFGESGAGLPDVTVNGASPHMFPPGQFTVQGSIRNPGDHVWYDLYAVSEPEPMGNGGDGKDPSQQLATTKFVFEGSKEICKSLFWDPYGRVFDSVSLEPLGENEAKVTLLDDKGQYVDVPSNNSPIDNLGKYNIFIQKDGLYKLKVTDMASHEFTTVTPDPKYKDLYERIYTLGDPPFEEKQNAPQRYDIPVKPIGQPYKRDIETIYKDQTIIWIAGEEYVKIEFRVSHPLTKIESNIDGGVLCEQTETAFTDKEGFCTFTVKASLVPQEGIELRKIKNPDYYLTYDKNLIRDFTAGLLSVFSKEVSAQQTIRIGSPKEVQASEDLTFDPILRYVEGFAYNDNGVKIPKAKVDVVLTMNNAVFYSTTADDSGFFTIYKKNLPPLEYYLRFTDPTSSKILTQKTSVFIKNNEPYIQSEKINLMAATKENQPVVNSQTGQLNKIAKPTARTTVAASDTSKNSTSAKVAVVIFVLILLVVSALGIVVYIKKSRPVF